VDANTLTVTGYLGTNSSGPSVGTVQVDFEAGDATQVASLTIEDDEIVLDGQTSVTATILDANNNPVEGVQVSFASNETDRATVESPVNTGSNGQATATVTGANDQAGEVTITASISASDGNVAASDSETVGLTVLAGSADAAQSGIGASPAGGLTANGSDGSTLTITVRDSGGNLLEGEDVFFAITGGTGGSLSSGPWSTDVSGEATATLTSVDANTLTVTGYLGTDSSGPSVGTVQVDFEAGEAESLSATATQATAAADGSDELEFLVTVEDANENPVSGVQVVVTDNGTDINYTGGGNSQSTDVTGQVTFTATSTTPQSDITFTFTEQDQNNINTAIGSFIDNSGFSLTDPGPQSEGEEFNLVITDAQNVSGESLDGTVNVVVNSDIDDIVHNDTVTFTEGSASVPVTLTTVDDHTLTVNVDGISDNQSIQVTVVAGET
jgi:hypothetical protein